MFSLIIGQVQRFGKCNLEQRVSIDGSVPRRQFCSKKHPQACALWGRGPQSLRILHGTLWNLLHLQLYLHISSCPTCRRRATTESTLVLRNDEQKCHATSPVTDQGPHCSNVAVILHHLLLHSGWELLLFLNSSHTDMWF